MQLPGFQKILYILISAPTLFAVSLFKPVFALFLTVNFLFCAIHCQGEALKESAHAPHATLQVETSHSDSDHDCGSCQACEWIHGGVMKSNQRVLPSFVSILAHWNVLKIDLFENSTSLLTCQALAPPESAKTWQFAFRTALPARAPSLLS